MHGDVVSWKEEEEEGFLDGAREPGDVVSEGVGGRIVNLRSRPLNFLLLAIMGQPTDAARQKNNEKGSDASSQRAICSPFRVTCGATLSYPTRTIPLRRYTEAYTQHTTVCTVHTYIHVATSASAENFCFIHLHSVLFKACKKTPPLKNRGI